MRRVTESRWRRRIAAMLAGAAWPVMAAEMPPAPKPRSDEPPVVEDVPTEEQIQAERLRRARARGT